MLLLEELKERFRTNYPNKLTPYTQFKRRINIASFNNFIQKDIDENDLRYLDREYRLLVYNTYKNEKVYIQYPGLISTRPRSFKMDFKPIIVNEQGDTCENATFQKMWDVFEAIIDRHKELLPILSLIFFRMGRMIGYDYVIDKYPIYLVENNTDIIDLKKTHEISFYKIKLEKDEIEALNYNVGEVEFQPGFSVSFEAFIYFFDMILQIEDCKYFIFNNGSLKSGRIPTSDSMILLATYFKRSITISSMLQKFLKGNGVGNCSKREYLEASNSLINFTDQIDIIKQTLESHEVTYKIGSKTINGVNVKAKMIIPDKKICFYYIRPDDSVLTILSNNEWKYVILNEEFEKGTINNTLESLL